MLAVIDYHVAGAVGSFEVRGRIADGDAYLFTIVEGIGYAFLLPPPETMTDYLQEGMNAIYPAEFEDRLSFPQALSLLTEGWKRRKAFQRELDDPEMYKGRKVVD